MQNTPSNIKKLRVRNYMHLLIVHSTVHDVRGYNGNIHIENRHRYKIHSLPATYKTTVVTRQTER